MKRQPFSPAHTVILSGANDRRVGMENFLQFSEVRQREGVQSNLKALRVFEGSLTQFWMIALEIE